MGFLSGKRILITGLLSNRSIAYGIAQAMHREGAELAFTYQNDRVQDRVAKLAADFGKPLLFPCDVAEDAQIDALFAGITQQWGYLDGLVHSIAYAPNEALEGDFLELREHRVAESLSGDSSAVRDDEHRSFDKGVGHGLLNHHASETVQSAKVTSHPNRDQGNFGRAKGVSGDSKAGLPGARVHAAHAGGIVPPRRVRRANSLSLSQR